MRVDRVGRHEQRGRCFTVRAAFDDETPAITFVPTTLAGKSRGNSGSHTLHGAPVLIAGPMKLTQLAFAFGHMVGDYVGAAIIPGGIAFAAFAVGGIPADGQAFSEPMYEPYRDEPVTGGSAPASAAGVRPGLREAPMPGITR